MDWMTACKEYGFMGLVMGAVIAAFFFLLKWILEQFKVELVGNRQERKEYLEILNSLKSEISEHNARAKEFHTSSIAEHKEMITVLGRINGYKHD